VQFCDCFAAALLFCMTLILPVILPLVVICGYVTSKAEPVVILRQVPKRGADGGFASASAAPGGAAGQAAPLAAGLMNAAAVLQNSFVRSVSGKPVLQGGRAHSLMRMEAKA
jgi:hypothetical protein